MTPICKQPNREPENLLILFDMSANDPQKYHRKKRFMHTVESGLFIITDKSRSKGGGSLDRKTGLITGLIVGKQDWKCPVALIATCCGSKSLKVILIDSDFGDYPVLNPRVLSRSDSHTVIDQFPEVFLENDKNFFFHQPLAGSAGYQRWGMEEGSTHLDIKT